MKIGNIEGTPQEIKDFFEINGSDLGNFISSNQPKKRWLIAPALTVVCCCVGGYFVTSLNPEYITLCFIAGILSVGWLGGALQVLYGKWPATYLAVVVCIFAVFVACQLLAPDQVFSLLMAKVTQ